MSACNRSPVVEAAATQSSARDSARRSAEAFPQADPMAQGANVLLPLMAVYKTVRSKTQRMNPVPGMQGPYLPPTPGELSALTALMSELLSEARGAAGVGPSTTLQAKAGALGLTLEAVEGLNELWVLREIAGKARGWGAYLVRTGKLGREVILQAPHTFYDEGTGPVAVRWFAALPFRALFFNTVHRYSGAETGAVEGGEDGDDASDACPTDVAHNPAHPFQAATEGLSVLAVTPTGAVSTPVQVVQVHGFKGSARTAGAAVIVSAADRQGLSRYGETIAAGWGTLVEGVLRYPTQIRQLGGTHNFQAKWLQQAENMQFIHIELSDAMRQELASNSSLLMRLGAMLLR